MPSPRRLTRDQWRGISDGARKANAGPFNRFVTMADVDRKISVDVATTAATSADLATAAPSTIDGVTLEKGMRVLMMHHSSPAKNGPYVVEVVGTGSNGTWSRPTDADEASELGYGVTYEALKGTNNKNHTFSLSINGAIVIGTTHLLFVDTTPVALAGAPCWRKFSIEHTALITSGTVTLYDGAGQDLVVDDAFAVTRTVFAASGLTALALKLGHTGTTDSILLSITDVKGTGTHGNLSASKGAALPVNAATAANVGLDSADLLANTQILATFTAAGAALTALTAGKIDVYVKFAVAAQAGRFA